MMWGEEGADTFRDITHSTVDRPDLVVFDADDTLDLRGMGLQDVWQDDGLVFGDVDLDGPADFAVQTGHAIDPASILVRCAGFDVRTSVAASPQYERQIQKSALASYSC